MAGIGGVDLRTGALVSAADLRRAGLVLEDLRGIGYNPLTRKAWLADSVAVNYLACALKPA